MSQFNESAHYGTTLAELKDILFSELDNQMISLDNAKAKIGKTELFLRRRDLLTILEEKGMRNIVKTHLDGGFHIRNTGEFYPIAFQHNFSLILKHGLRIINIDSSPSRELRTAISHLNITTEAIQKNLTNFHQSFDFLNVFLAPYVKNATKTELKKMVRGLVYNFYHLFNMSAIRTFIGLETEVPSFLKKEPAYFHGKEIGKYGDFEKETEELFNVFTSILAKEDKIYPTFFVKLRNKTLPENLDKFIDKVYFVNLNPKWQTENANCMFDWCRFDASWKTWQESIGVSEMQMVSLNLPRFGLITKDEDKVLELIDEKIKQIKSCFLVSLEGISSQLFTKMSFLTKSIEGDNYCNFKESIFNVGVCGLTNLLEKINGDDTLGINIIKHIEEESKIKEPRLRTGVIELDFYPATQRFITSNNKLFKSNDSNYFGGVNKKLADEEKIIYYSKFQKNLKGGHMCPINSLTPDLLEDILKSQIGCFSDKKKLVII